MRPPQGATLLVLLLTAMLAVNYGRGTFREEGSPAFFVEKQVGVRVRLGEGFPVQGIHQFSDGVTIKAVIEMTALSEQLADAGLGADPRPLEDGESLALITKGGEVVEIARFWMTASKRVALGIPLHPDRMSVEDWTVLPGIGAKTAFRIEKDRQQNGDFHSLDRLVRVRGIGPKSIEKWSEFFQTPQLPEL